MKSFIITVGLIVFLISSSSFERFTDRPPSTVVLTAFQMEFENATHVRWEQKQNLFLVHFNLDEYRVLAFYSAEGQLLGTARSILPDQLPLIQVMELKRRFENCNIYSVTEYTVGGSLYYVLTIETQTKKLQVKLLSSGGIDIRKVGKGQQDDTF